MYLYKKTQLLSRVIFCLLAISLYGCTTIHSPAEVDSGNIDDIFYSTSTVYSSADVEGRVIDEETGEPITGAVVVGIWQLETQGLGHIYGPAIHVVESVTDKEGRYHLEGFEDLKVPCGAGTLMGRDPVIYILAEDYKPIGTGRSFNDKTATGTHRVSPLNGQDIPLKRMALSNRFEAANWSSTVRMLLDNAGKCVVTKLTATGSLLERIEPQFNRIIKEFYGWNEDRFKQAKEGCK